MIISASYKTDIPTFYGDWFMNRVSAGYCKVVNPYNGRVGRVSLRREDVDAFVFWTKNVGPFLPHLQQISERGYPFVVQHTINGYPRALESAVTDAFRSIRYLRHIADVYGSRVAVWRYDTVLFTSLTDFDFHLRNFEELARELDGAVDEVVISFAHFYQKTRRNLQAASDHDGFVWRDPSADEKRALVQGLVERAQAYRMQLTICSQPEYQVIGAGEARCIDAERLREVGGTALRARLKGNRSGCGCYESRDIGEYDTCPHGCVYCYAVRNHPTAKDRFRRHDPASEFLFSPPNTTDQTSSGYDQLPIVGLT